MTLYKATSAGLVPLTPEEEIEMLSSIQTPPPSTKISVGAFFDRFGYHQIPILASQIPEVQAVIKTASVREYIDLANPTLPVMLQIIVDAGFSISIPDIIDSPVQDYERPGA